MLTPDEIEDIITDLSCRNAAGGIYTGSVHPFARAIEKAAEAAAIERCAKRVERESLDLFGMPVEMRITARAHVADDLRALLRKDES